MDPKDVRCWHYYIRGTYPHPPFGWAEIVLVSTGMFAAVSDYGDYAYAWRPMGSPIREFILTIDDHYLLCKIAPTREYDGPRTERAVKERILELRRAGDISKRVAREEWDLLDEHENLDQREHFALWYNETRLHDHTSDVHELACLSRNPQAVMFAQRILPLLKQAIRDEIAEEEKKR